MVIQPRLLGSLINHFQPWGEVVKRVLKMPLLLGALRFPIAKPEYASAKRKGRLSVVEESRPVLLLGVCEVPWVIVRCRCWRCC